MMQHRLTPRTVARLCASALMTALCAATPSAHADPNPYTLSAQQTIEHDSNLLRAPDGNAPGADWVSSTALLLDVNQPLGRERLKANGLVSLDRFRSNTQLNAISHRAAVELDWATVGDLSGEIGGNQAAELYHYATSDGQVYDQKNIQTTSELFAHARLGVVTRWTLQGELGLYRRAFSAQPFRSRDLRRDFATLRTIYQSSPDLAFNGAFRHTRGAYPNFSATLGTDDFSRNDLTLGATFAPSGASRLTASVGAARETHSQATLRDSRYWTASLQWLWQATGRTQLTLGLLRDNDTGATDIPFAFGDLASTDARIRTAFTGKAAYNLTGKIDLTASGGFSRRQLDSAFALVPDAGARGGDRLYNAALGLDYRPTRTSDIACNLSRERRTVQGSTPSITYGYSANVISCSGSIGFN